MRESAARDGPRWRYAHVGGLPQLASCVRGESKVSKVCFRERPSDLVTVAYNVLGRDLSINMLSLQCRVLRVEKIELGKVIIRRDVIYAVIYGMYPAILDHTRYAVSLTPVRL